MDQSASQLTKEELNCLMDKWENETLVQIADQAEERGQSEEQNSLMDKALVQIADQAGERSQSEEQNSLMDKMENDTLVEIADQTEKQSRTEELNS